MQYIENELKQWSTIEPKGIRVYKIVESKINDKDNVYVMTINQMINNQSKNKEIKVTKLFCIFSVDDTKNNESGNLYRLRKTIDLIEHEFVQEYEKGIRELLNYF